MTTFDRSTSRSWLASLTILGALATSSCVSQQQHDEAVAEWKRWQTTALEAENKAASLVEENGRLQSQLRQDNSRILNVGYNDAMARLSELQKQFEERQAQGPINDIQRFDVEGGYVFMIQDKVLFASGSADIGDEGKRALKDLSDQIGSKAHGRVVVRGHTDSDPVVKQATKERFPKGNLQLSAERAVSVASFLIESKVPARDVVVAGYGEWEPVSANSSADNKRLNRRVEIFVADE